MLPLGTRTEQPLTEDVKDVLVMNIGRMTLQPLKIQADIELKCFKFDAVLHTKEAIRKSEAVGNDDCPVKIKLVVPPLYVLKEAIRKSEAVGNDGCPVKKIKLVVPPLYVPKHLKIQADIELKCFKFDVVLHTKEAIRKSEMVGNDDCTVKIKLVVPPLYVLKEAIRKLESVGNDDCPMKIKLVVPPLYVLKGVYHEHTLLGVMTAITSASSSGIPSSNAATKFLLCPSGTGSGGVYIASGSGSGSGVEDLPGVPEVLDVDSIKYFYAPMIRNICVIHIYQNLNYKAKVGEDSLFPDSGLVAYPDLNCPLFTLDQSHWRLDTLIVDPVRSGLPTIENIRYLYSRQSSSSAVLVNHNSLYNLLAGEASTDPIPNQGIHAFLVQPELPHYPMGQN